MACLLKFDKAASLIFGFVWTVAVGSLSSTSWLC